MKERILQSLLRFWLSTLRMEWTDLKMHNVIYALWHQDLPACMAAFAGRGIVVQISASKDGSIAASVATSLGYQVVRGSTTRKSGSIRHQLKALQDGKCVGVALDGPRGPAKVAKLGAQWLSQKSGCEVVFLHIGYSCKWNVATWDQMSIPFPFSRVKIEASTSPIE